MTLEETIKYEEELAKEKQDQADSNIQFERNGTKFLYDGEEYKKCFECAKEHRQLAEWLKDYKRLLEQEHILDKIKAEITDTGAYEQETMGQTAFLNGINYCLGVIDRYRAEADCRECKVEYD